MRRAARAARSPQFCGRAPRSAALGPQLRGARAIFDAPTAPRPRSEITAEGKRVTKLDQILLNGNNVALLVPGGSPDY